MTLKQRLRLDCALHQNMLFFFERLEGEPMSVSFHLFFPLLLQLWCTVQKDCSHLPTEFSIKPLKAFMG